jgi:phosphoribosylglycinamide formyltransferase-1
MSIAPAPVVVLISGRGSNLQAITEQMLAGRIPIVIAAVISNRPEAAGLAYARAAGIATEVVDHRRFADRADFERALMAAIDRHQPRLVLLAGFMRVLGREFIQHYYGRLLNIHPALLPAFPGLDTHARALESGVKEHGASVHFVTEEVDGGPVIVQARVPVHADDTVETLSERVLAEEHRIYPLAIRWLVEGHVRMEDGQVLLDGRPLTANPNANSNS